MAYHQHHPAEALECVELQRFVARSVCVDRADWEAQLARDGTTSAWLSVGFLLLFLLAVCFAAYAAVLRRQLQTLTTEEWSESDEEPGSAER